MVRGIANSKIGFGDLILLLRYFFKLKVSTHPNKRRIGIEHVFGRLKTFKILAVRYRNRGKRLGLRFNLIAGVYNMELSEK